MADIPARDGKTRDPAFCQCCGEAMSRVGHWCEKMTARDGETLSDERAILSDDQVELIREEARSTATAEGFMLAHGSPTAHDILLLCDSHAALRAEVAAAKAVIEAARRMPRETPGPGSASTVHRFRLSAAAVWALDRALTAYDAARAASGEDASHE